MTNTMYYLGLGGLGLGGCGGGNGGGEGGGGLGGDGGARGLAVRFDKNGVIDQFVGHDSWMNGPPNPRHSDFFRLC